MTVNVSDDSEAYLALTPSDGPNSEFADDNGDALSLSFGDSGNNGTGLNDDARTIIRDVFRIENQGTQDVFVFVENDSVPDGIGVFSDEPATTPSGNSDATTGLGNNKPGFPPEKPPVSKPITNFVPTGKIMDEIGFSFNTGSRGGVGDLDFDLEVKAVESSQFTGFTEP
jgi:hypothetical protein